MALLRYNRYPGNFASATSKYPQGAFKNISGPNATDGSYAEADWLNDWDGFFGRLLTVAGISPNGSVDNAQSSQYYDALTALISRATPSGMVAVFAMQSAPSGWLGCNGNAVSRSTYASLFAAIGTTWGSGDGSTTFNLPDFRGEFLRGWDNGRGVDPNRGFATFQDMLIQSHGHGLTMNSVPDHVHNFTFAGGSNGSGGVELGATQSSFSGTTQGAGGHTPSGTVGSTGGAETRPRNKAVLYCIKT